MANEDKNLVDIGVIPYDVNDNLNKCLTLSVNGKSLMLDRGKRAIVPPEFAEAYYHRVSMAGRRMKERTRREREIREKQNAEGVKFM